MGRSHNFFLGFLAVILSCSSLDKSRNDAKETLVIRYFSLRAVYNTMAERSSELKSAGSSRDNLVRTIKILEEQLLMAADKKEIMRKLNDEREKLDKADKELAYIKSKIFDNINRALKITADTMGADFVLNIGDELLYSKKKFDITDEIIREINKIEFRSQPVNR